MENRKIMWNGTVRALPLREQLRAAAIAGCDALSLTPSDYNRWLGSAISTRDMLAMADDAGVRLSHLDPFIRWVDDWVPYLPGESFPAEIVAFDADDFFGWPPPFRSSRSPPGAGFGQAKLPALRKTFKARTLWPPLCGPGIDRAPISQ